MFERRLKVILVLPVFFGIFILTRLFQLQVLKGADYREQSEAALVAPKQFLPPLRGRILDRFGHVLVSDEPAHDVTLHYGILSMDRTYLLRFRDSLGQNDPRWRSKSRAEQMEEVERRIADMWLALEKATGVPLTELRRRRDAICQSVEGLRRHIASARRDKGLDDPTEKIRLKEEDLRHAIVRNISPEVRTRIELAAGDLPFLRVEPSVRRIWSADAQPVCHVLGRLGQVSSAMIDADPMTDDPLACYRADDEAGVSGIERLGEAMLRGKRGYEECYLDKRIKTRVSAIDGLDVQLTIDLDLQRQIAEILAEAVKRDPNTTGGSCVVIDVQTREILALVSVPTYDPQTFESNYPSLRDDAKNVPLRFRAVGEEYQPGSILKPVALLAGLSHKIISPQQTVICNGQLIPGSNKWHCWTHWKDMPGHGPMDAEAAIQHSCNVYFYTLGEKIGARRLTDFYADFIRGPSASTSSQRGTGLIEERSGLIPTQDWLRNERKREFGIADGRNYAIGQGEIQITPLQAANMFATIAVGAYRDPTLLANEGRDRPTIRIPGVSTDQWQTVRRGLYRCVNESDGTAYKYARMEGLSLCGKTGSAQCVSKIVETRYTFEPDNSPAQTVVASTEEAARAKLNLPATAKIVRREAVSRWPLPDPAKGKIPTHAWFAGFAPLERPRIAIAVVVEYGGPGGNTAGPVARQMLEAVANSPREYFGRSTMNRIAASHLDTKLPPDPTEP